MLRPAWAHSYGCKSRRMLITTSEVQLHEGDRVWEGCWNINWEPINKNRIWGTAK